MKHLTDEAAHQLFVVLSKAQNIVDPSLSKEHTAWYCELANAISIMQAAIDAQPPSGERAVLTRAQLDAIWDGTTPYGLGKSRYDIARAIESAHGIKEQP